MTPRNNFSISDPIYKMGTRLRELRVMNNLTIEKLSEDLGISPRMLYNYESGNNALSIEMIIRLHESKAFKDRSLSELLQIFIVEIYDSLN